MHPGAVSAAPILLMYRIFRSLGNDASFSESFCESDPTGCATVGFADFVCSPNFGRRFSNGSLPKDGSSFLADAGHLVGGRGDESDRR